MGRVPNNHLIHVAAVSGLGLWAGIVGAQTLDGGVVAPPPDLPAPTVYASPVPLARVAPPEQPVLDPSIAGAVGTVVEGSGSEDGNTTVTVRGPDGETSVRVVFNDGNEPLPGEEAEDQTRGGRFTAAPKPRPVPETFGPNQAVPINAPRTRLIQGATLRSLDKMTGTTRTHSIAVGDEQRIERLRVRLEGCRAPSDGDSHGTIAFLKIWDTKYPDAESVFTGWMFAESPALSALDHSRYDLWVIKCTTSPGEQSAAKE